MIKEATKDNLPKRLTELGIVDDHEITVADQTSPKSIIIKIKLTCNME
jgi:Fe2+ transport system protein FeoA